MKTISIAPLGRWWSIRLHCRCGCDQIARVTIAATVAAAVSKFRASAREIRTVQGADA